MVSKFQKQQSNIIDLDRLPRYLGYQIRQAQTAVFRDIDKKMKSIGVTPSEFGLLSIISANSGIHQKTLTKYYGLDKSTLSFSVNRLIKRKLVNRKKDPDDGRYYGLWVTKAGKEKARVATGYIEAQEDLMDSILVSKEREQLLGMLVRISNVLT